MDTPDQLYKTQLDLNTKTFKRISKQMRGLSILRLAVFLITGFGLYLSFEYWQIATLIAIVGIIAFLLLLSRYTDLKTKRALHKRLAQINSDELDIASGNFHDRYDGKEFQSPDHFYSLDIDLFGKGSFFQYLNRTTIKEGTLKLKNDLLANNPHAIKTRQEAIKELSELPLWRQNYMALAQGFEVEHPATTIIDSLKSYQPFLSSKHYWLTVLYGFISLTIIILGFVKLVPVPTTAYRLLLWLIIGLGITGFYLKRINRLAQVTEKAKDTFKQYALLLKCIENEKFQSQLLKNQKDKIRSDALEASEIFMKLSKTLDALDNRNNLISAIVGNGLLLIDVRHTYKIEKWLGQYAHKVEDWFEVVTFFDAYNSLGNFAFNHLEFSYPILSDTSPTISAKGLGHPLLRREKRIVSDLELEQHQFFIVTGANMAGKSTFLRTVALHIVMANVGLPVCATESQYQPIKLITSMRTTDSLTDDSSYFFSELTRLKFIVNTLEEDTNYFVILDEILKGTNSTDKAIGSKKFVEKLVKQNATGIIATHDLSLTKIEEQLGPVKNYFFDAEISNDELYFDYKLKQGVCKNMNASFLLKKMKII